MEMFLLFHVFFLLYNEKHNKNDLIEKKKVRAKSPALQEIVNVRPGHRAE